MGLQHNTTATPWDAEMALSTVESLLHFFMLARVRHEHGAPARRPCTVYPLRFVPARR